MKNFKLIVLLFTTLTLGLSSCRKTSPADEPKPDTPAQAEAKAKIMGKWKITGATFVKTSNGQTAAPVEHDFTEKDFFFDFKADNKVMVNYITRTGEYSYNFSEDGKNFTAAQVGTSSIVYDVKENTSTQLVLFTTHILADAQRQKTSLYKSSRNFVLTSGTSLILQIKREE